MSVKKSLGLALVIGLLAVAVGVLSASASAAEEEPVPTSPAGTVVPVGTTITATSTNAKTVVAPAVGTLECEKVVVNGVVTADSKTAGVGVAIDGKTHAATGCKLAGVAITVTPTFESLILTKASKTAEFTFTTSTGLSESSTSTVTYTTGTPNIHVEGKVVGSQAGTLSTDFTAVVKSTGKGVIFD